MFSSVKKISLAHTRRKYKHFKFQPFRADIGSNTGTTKSGAIDHNKTDKNQKDLLSGGVQNYNMVNEEILRNLGYIRKHGMNQVKYLTDPTAQYIDRGSPLSNMSDRNLPSPSEVKGESHLVSMPFFQELPVEESRRATQVSQ
jgi:hypothetical protein